MTHPQPHAPRRTPAPRALAALLAALTVAALLAACGGSSAATSTTVPSAAPAASPTAAAPTASPAMTATSAVATATETRASPPPVGQTASPSASPAGDALTLNVYFLRDGKIATGRRVVPRTLQVAAAAMTELLNGPTDAERASGFASAIPAGTRYIGTAIEDTIATVNLSGDFASAGGDLPANARLAQVVYTLTQFPTVRAVQFALDGQPVDVFGADRIALDRPQTRADYEDLTPAILVESPVAGEQVSRQTLRISGTANTFEATFSARVTDASGQTLAEQVVTATSGSGTRGTFDATLTLAPTQTSQGTLTVFEPSAKDGSPTNVVEIPLNFAR